MFFAPFSSMTLGLPSVRVPVLSRHIVSILDMCSSADASLTSIPERAPRPMPTIIAVGVASPSAHGQAMTSTDTAAITPNGTLPAPDTAHTANVMTDNVITAGTNTRLMRSTSFCTGALEPCASRTLLMMRASSVSAPTDDTETSIVPSPFRVPALTLSPTFFSTPADSPESMLSSTAVRPALTTPSAGTRSPGRTTMASPAERLSALTSSKAPSADRR